MQPSPGDFDYDEETAADLGRALREILDDVAAFLRRYVVFPIAAQVVAVALWIAHTHLVEQFDTTPYLWIHSPEKRSGKSRLLDLLELVVARAWLAILPTEATAYRKIAADHPTLLLDEIDAVFGPKARDHEGLRALLNAGHRQGASVPRCVGPPHSIRIQQFAVYGAKALAGLGQVPDTVGDRSIPIRLARRLSTDPVGRFRRRDVAPIGYAIQARLAAWADRTDLQEARPEIPEALDDRAADGWESLLAIADLAGGRWPERARGAALELHADPEGLEQSDGIRLLADLQMIFEDQGGEAAFTVDLLADLGALEESPWGEYRGAKALSAHQLARLLRPYGVRPKTVWIAGVSAKGYRRAGLQDAWERYLAPPALEPPSDPSGRQDPVKPGTYERAETSGEFDPSGEKPNEFNHLDGLTDEMGGEGGRVADGELDF